MIRALNFLRCRIAIWLISRQFEWRYAIARRLMPSTDSLVRHSPRRQLPLKLPKRSHLLYHQSTVDRLCAENSLRSLSSQIPSDDEILILDVGATADAGLLGFFENHAWRSYAACLTTEPEQESYTYGMNAYFPRLLANQLFIWRTDYVYPPGTYQAYHKILSEGYAFASPYWVWIGHQTTDSRFLKEHWERLHPTFDSNFWREHSKPLSLYETQDPALFAIDRELWERIGGLNHSLWGYGWQFGELAAQVRNHCPANQIAYFECPPPIHQTHQGSLLLEPAEKKAIADAGIARFARFLGGMEMYACYRHRQILPPRAPAQPKT